MDPVTIAAAGTAASGLFSSIGNFFSQQSANETNVKLARENRAWQERMANTEVQRRKADLAAAGFNPLLAAGGNGASTPSGSVAHVGAPELTPIDLIGIEKLRADISRTRAETAVAEATKDNVIEQNNKLKAENQLLGLDARVRNANLYKMEQDAHIEDTWYGRNILAPIRTTLGAIGNIFGRVPEYMPKTVKGR